MYVNKRNIDDFAMMTPMRYYDNPEPATATLRQKRLDMINNKDNAYVASVKHDGDWAMFIHYSKGHNLIRSRSLSKVTGVYGDYTEKLPTAVEVMETWPDSTVILAEVCVAGNGNNANTIGTILRCLPEKAIERQKTVKVQFWAFDMLMWNGQDLTEIPYIDRLYGLEALLNNEHEDCEYYGKPWFRCTEVFADGFDFAEEADRIIREGGEGLVIQKKDNEYWPGTRTAWKTLKLKQKLDDMELVVLDALMPTRDYNGDAPESWPYWEVQDVVYATLPPQPSWTLHQTSGGPDPTWKLNGWNCRPVTKPWFFGWRSAIRVKYKDGYTDVASGLTDDDRAWLASNEGQAAIQSGQLMAVVHAMSENDLGKLRHPVFVRFRYPEEK